MIPITHWLTNLRKESRTIPLDGLLDENGDEEPTHTGVLLLPLLTPAQYYTQEIVHGIYTEGAWMYESLVEEYVRRLRLIAKPDTVILWLGISRQAVQDGLSIFKHRCETRSLLKQIVPDTHRRIIIPIMVDLHCSYIEYHPLSGVILVVDTLHSITVPETINYLIEQIKISYGELGRLQPPTKPKYLPNQLNHNDCGIYLCILMTLTVLDEWVDNIRLVCPPMVKHMRRTLSRTLLATSNSTVSTDVLRQGIATLPLEHRQWMRQLSTANLQKKWLEHRNLWQRPTYIIPEYMPPLLNGRLACDNHARALRDDGFTADRLVLSPCCTDIIVVLNEYLGSRDDPLRYNFNTNSRNQYCSTLIPVVGVG